MIRVGTVLEQMRYDLDRIVVQAGKPVEILFENIDMMPHNFVVTRPGALEEIGLLAEATATQPGALERQYIPASNKILLSSRLLQPRESQKLSFTAPGSRRLPLCLHLSWPLAADVRGPVRRRRPRRVPGLPRRLPRRNPLPIADELLKSNRPRKEWTFDDLASAAEPLDTGRSFGNGKQLFEVATCVSCHRMSGVGNEFGPDLTKLDPQMRKPADLLRNILEPSSKINEKYATYLFETETGKVVSGLVVEETPDVVKVVENPLANAEPVVLKNPRSPTAPSPPRRSCPRACSTS